MSQRSILKPRPSSPGLAGLRLCNQRRALATAALFLALLPAPGPGSPVASVTDGKVRSPALSPREILRQARGAPPQPSRWDSAGVSRPPRDLVVLPPHLTDRGKTILLRRPAARALQRLHRAAARDGIHLVATSGYRDFAHQARLYHEAVRRHGPGQKMVARPGRSEHQLGDTVDFTDGNRRHTLNASFGQSPAGQWLRRNGPRHGWHLTVSYEPWHARYRPSRFQRFNPLRILGLM